MNQSGWSDSWHEVFQIRFLYWAYDTTRGSRVPPVNSFLEQLQEVGAPDGYAFDKTSIKAIVDTLAAEQLIHVGKSFGGVLSSHVHPTERGTAEVIRRRQRRANAVEREVACRDALLAWLYACKRAGESAVLPTGFVADPRGHFEGDLFASDDIFNAVEYLKAKGLIEGAGAWDGMVPRPFITADGEDIVEHYEGSVQDYIRSKQRPPAGTQVTNLFHGNQNTVQTGIAGGDVTQSQRVSQGIDPAELANHLKAIREAADDLSDDDRQRVLAIVQVLDDTEPDGLDESFVQTLLGRLGNLASKIGNAALTAAVAAATTGLLA